MSMSNSLDAGQYTHQEIAKYEAIYGRNFISPGGLATTKEFTALLDLQPGLRVLDVGCGIGGGTFYLAQHYEVTVQGIDLSANMIALAQERCQEAGLTERVTLLHGDIMTFVPQPAFDRIYSRDVFLHIHDKPRLLQVLKACLQPGGWLLFTDYCCGPGEKSSEFAAYVQQRAYDLRTVTAYQQLLLTAGFTEVTAQDRTAHFIRILEQELAAMPADRFDPPTLQALRQSWQAKLERAQRGEQRWGLFLARRPQL